MNVSIHIITNNTIWYHRSRFQNSHWHSENYHIKYPSIGHDKTKNINIYSNGLASAAANQKTSLMLETMRSQNNSLQRSTDTLKAQLRELRQAYFKELTDMREKARASFCKKRVDQNALRALYDLLAVISCPGLRGPPHKYHRDEVAYALRRKE